LIERSRAYVGPLLRRLTGNGAMLNDTSLEASRHPGV